MSQKIANDQTKNWAGLNEIRSYNTKLNPMDLYDLANFYKFFKELYSKKTLPAFNVKGLEDAYTTRASISQDVTTGSLTEELNKDVTETELCDVIKKLKNGKATSEDCHIK